MIGGAFQTIQNGRISVCRQNDNGQPILGMELTEGKNKITLVETIITKLPEISKEKSTLAADRSNAGRMRKFWRWWGYALSRFMEHFTVLVGRGLRD